MLNGTAFNKTPIDADRTFFDVCVFTLDASKNEERGRRRAIFDVKTTETEGFVENARIFAKKVALFRRALG